MHLLVHMLKVGSFALPMQWVTTATGVVALTVSRGQHTAALLHAHGSDAMHNCIINITESHSFNAIGHRRLQTNR
jgi:hypothetical protein